MKRIFIAVKTEPGPELNAMVSFFKRALNNEKIKWSEFANMHITLVFLGDTDELKIRVIDKLLKELCSDFQSFSFRISGARVFRNMKDPRVIWAGITETEKLKELNSIILSALREKDIVTEERDFSPHLTLGRIKNISDTEILKRSVESFRNKSFQIVNVSEIILYESILRPEGPLYKPLGKYQLLPSS